MTRIDFTERIVNLLTMMLMEGETPIIDFVKRSVGEQNRLFNKGLSKCDGYQKKSQHQFGKAADIYFVGDGKLVDPKLGWEYWHKEWEELGGAPMLSWDRAHFEVE